MYHSFYRYLCCLTLSLTSHLLIAHDLQYSVTDSSAIVVKLFYADNSAFAYENYEIYRPGQSVPMQVGRTDDQGRVAFLPTQVGKWQIKTFSEDGHGIHFGIEVGQDKLVQTADKPLFDRYARLFVGLAIILGLFGCLSLFYRKEISQQ